ncbi:MAG: hypothetical protein RID01_01670 [Algiphilus sp.]
MTKQSADPVPESYTAHATAISDEGAQNGAGSRIWQWVHVCGGARIGEGVSLGQNVFAFRLCYEFKLTGRYKFISEVPLAV